MEVGGVARVRSVPVVRPSPPRWWGCRHALALSPAPHGRGTAPCPARGPCASGVIAAAPAPSFPSAGGRGLGVGMAPGCG